MKFENSVLNRSTHDSLSKTRSHSGMQPSARRTLCDGSDIYRIPYHTRAEAQSICRAGGNKSTAAGKRVLDLCLEHGTSEQTFCNWKAKYGGMRVNTTRTVMSHHLN